MTTRRELLGWLSAAPIVAAAAPASDAASLTVVARGLKFPEGALAYPDGSVVVSEIAAGRLTRVRADGAFETIAEPGGGPNGNAFGPGGTIYSCNNGGFSWSTRDGLLIPEHRAQDYASGRIDRIDPRTGAIETLYRACEGRTLSAPNDLVFDDQGGFWFTDHGATSEQGRDHGGIYYARADGSRIVRAIHTLIGPNGIALAPDGRTLYVALTHERQILAFDVLGPGELSPQAPLPGRVLASFGGRDYLDSMRLEADGTLCIGTLVASGIRRVTSRGRVLELMRVPDLIPATLCFGGPGLRTAWITGSTTGTLHRVRWPAPGLRLTHQPI
jgi:gluconolactonase